MKYKKGDRIKLRKSCDVLDIYDALSHKDTYEIAEIEVDDEDTIPYLINFYIRGVKDTWWISENDIKGLASVVRVGGK